MTTRADVAAAINTAAIDGVTGSVYAPQTKRPGVAWAQWVASELRQMADGTVVPAADGWQVLCLLPEVDAQQTADALDAWLPAVLDALAPHYRLTRAIPTSYTVAEGMAMPAFSISILAP